MNSMFIFFIAIVIVSCIFSLLGWYRRKELQELASVDFQLFSAENNLEYVDNGQELISELDRINLLPGAPTSIKNILISEYKQQTLRIFNSESTVGSGQSKKLLPIVGVVINLKDNQLPRFTLKKKKRMDQFDHFGGAKKVDPELLPKWISVWYSLFHSARQDPNVAVALLSSKEQLRGELSDDNLHMLCGSGDCLIYYKVGSFEPSLASYRPFEQLGQLLADSFDSRAVADSQLPDDIQQIKQSKLKR